VLRLALLSLRHRTGAFAASFVSLFLGATILMAFASMLDTAGGPHVTATDEETLVTMASVVGGWGLLIVVFAVASTLTLQVRQRSREMALLKSVGATPGQVRRMIVGEAAAVSVVAAAAAVLPATVAGRLAFGLLQDSDQVAPAVDHRFGPIALGMGLGITFVAATAAALLTARRAAGMGAVEAVADADQVDPGPGEGAGAGAGAITRKRKVAAGVFLALGLWTGTLTVVLFDGEGSDAMQTAGQSSIWFAIGLALLSPALLRVGTAAAAGPLQRFGGAASYLTVQNLRRRTRQMAGAVRPVILFTAIATATITMQMVENDASSAAGVLKTTEERNIETLNFVVVGMIAVFAAIMLVNTLVVATLHRRRELGQQRLVGSTPPQVLAMVGLEAAVVAGTGVAAGAAASLVTIVPFTIARTDGVLPGTGLGVFAAVVAAAAGLTLASSVGAARRAVRPPAVEAVAIPA
jgi:ABC-type antimicrobial peptide transport system permease subunit